MHVLVLGVGVESKGVYTYSVCRWRDKEVVCTHVHVHCSGVRCAKGEGMDMLE